MQSLSWPTGGTMWPAPGAGDPAGDGWGVTLPRASTRVLERSRVDLDRWSTQDLPRDEHALANVVLAAAARHNAVVDAIEMLLSVRLERRLTPTEEESYRLLSDAERALYGLHGHAVAELLRKRVGESRAAGLGAGTQDGGKR